jgi:hypothetical protein
MEFQDIVSKLRPVVLSHVQLRLDPNNPRLIGENDYNYKNSSPLLASAQKNILSYYKRTTRYDVKELRDSIESVGFLKLDRPVVTRLKDDRGNLQDAYLVIEGNRRTAAVKWIAEDILEGLPIRDDVKNSIENIDALELDCEDLDDEFITQATWFLQGLRHISGVKPWGPYQQAELISRFKREGRSFTEAGKALGIGPRTAARMMRAYSALLNMGSDEEFSSYAQPSLFSHFEVAFAKPIISNWLGWKEDENKFTNTDELKRFYSLIVGDEETSPARAVDIRQYLPVVLESKNARGYLMQGFSLSDSNAIALAEKSSAPTWLAAVNDAIKKLGTLPWTFKAKDEDLEKLQELKDIIDKLLAHMAEK